MNKFVTNLFYVYERCSGSAKEMSRSCALQQQSLSLCLSVCVRVPVCLSVCLSLSLSLFVSLSHYVRNLSNFEAVVIDSKGVNQQYGGAYEDVGGISKNQMTKTRL